MSLTAPILASFVTITDKTSPTRLSYSQPSRLTYMTVPESEATSREEESVLYEIPPRNGNWKENQFRLHLRSG